jgi:DNA-directed RNA polymerase subunit RPC12/RpoP
MRFACSKCGAIVSAPDDKAGAVAPCPKCGIRLQIPKDPSPIGNKQEMATPPPLPVRSKEENLAVVTTEMQQAEPGQWPAKNPNMTISRTQGHILISLLALGLFIQVLTAFRATPTPKWEYKIFAPSDSFFEKQMNKLGDEGWELVFARRATSNLGDSPLYELILKRPK